MYVAPRRKIWYNKFHNDIDGKWGNLHETNSLCGFAFGCKDECQFR